MKSRGMTMAESASAAATLEEESENSAMRPGVLNDLIDA